MMQSNLFLFWLSILASCATTTQALALNSNHHPFFVNSRTEVLNLLHHPLQLQIATGELPLGSFRRLILDRGAIVEGLQSACSSSAPSSSSSSRISSLIDKEIEQHPNDSKRWNAAAEAAGKTIAAPPGIECYNCGGNHLNIDCPEDLRLSPSALALKSVLEMNGIAGASAVLRSYSFACKRLLEASESVNCNADDDDEDDNANAYMGWLEDHAVRWESLATACEEQMIIDDGNNNNNNNHNSRASSSSSYDICLSMFYNWIDTEASTTGIRSESKSNRNDMASLAEAIERIEPGYLATRDKNQSFIADITGAKDAQAKSDAAARKVNAAAAYLAAKKKNMNR